jgi:hypothetical protein
MPNLSGANILIVGESPETVGLRTRLIEFIVRQHTLPRTNAVASSKSGRS